MDRELNGKQITTVRVRYSEVDRMGFLYHVNYLEYFELARSDWVRNFWRPYKEIEDEGYSLVVIEVSLKYHRSAFYDDVLKIKTRPTDWGHSRITFEYAIYRKGETDPLCTGRTSHCFVGKDGKVTRMPEGLKETLVDAKLLSRK
ncbi:MAG: thioesterase family protein [Candidatus Hatepunaea meridiana]|nr:thioesterase family protein [Candidatus Hatepunaea meridiana]